MTRYDDEGDPAAVAGFALGVLFLLVASLAIGQVVGWVISDLVLQ